MTPDPSLEYQADMLMKKTKHYLITTIGRVADEANSDELYRALSYALREEVMINWLATTKTYVQKDVRMLYYLSMEYLPGRILSNTITNISAIDFVNRVLTKLDRNFNDIIKRENDPGLGNGGLGRLASCFLDSLATLHLPAQAYGLRYQYGIFEQQLWDGLQIEAPDCWLISENPWEFRRDLRKVTVEYSGKVTPSTNIHGDEIFNLSGAEEVWAMPYDIPIIGYEEKSPFSAITLRLWTTKESPRNFQIQSYNAGRLDQAAENTILTDVLYPSDHHEVGKRIRMKQEFLLVSASLQDIIRHYLASHDNFRAFADKIRIQINDTHPSLIIAELIRTLTNQYDIPWKMAVEITQACMGYTNHTILSEALEQWDQNLMSYLLPRQMKVIERLNQEFCNVIREKYPNDEDKVRRMSIIEKGQVRMAHLAIYGSHKINGVAEIHSEILKNKVFKDFYELYPDKFINITNGVTERRWLLLCNPDLACFITNKIGKGWITNFNEIRGLEAFAQNPEAQKEILTIKRKNKLRLIAYLKGENKLRNSRGEPTDPPPLIDIDSLFDIQAKRIHEYKRQLMNALHTLILYQEMLEQPTSRVPRTVIFAGKAAAGYLVAKDIIRLIWAIGRKINKDGRLSGRLKVVYIENYGVSKAEIIIPAADLSEQISTAGTEASGTGNMKFAMNGALTLGTEDGANIEMRQAIGDAWWPFSFGASAEQIEQMRASGSYQPRHIYESEPKIRRALDSLQDRSLAINEEEHQAFSGLFQRLVDSGFGTIADSYFILYDLMSYYLVQKKVDELYRQPDKWNETVIHNIAGMGDFSTDNSIKNYCEKVWGLEACPPDPEIEERVRYEYSLVDQCRIY